MAIQIQGFSVTLACQAGTDTEPVFGWIVRIDTDATACCIGATLDATWTTPALASGQYSTLAETPLTLTNLGNNSAVDYPRRDVDSTAGAALCADPPEMFFAPGQMTLTIAQGGACSDCAVVTGTVYYCNPDA